jgi:hypothetical protein
MLSDAEKTAKKLKEAEQRKILTCIENRQELKDQIREREKQKDEAFSEYLKERRMVDEALKKMIEEDRSDMLRNEEKKRMMHEHMMRSLEEKARMKTREKEEEEKLMERIKKYQEEAAQRETQLKLKKAEEDAAKEQIFAKLNEEEMKRRAEKEYIENLRIDLIQEEVEEAARLKELKEAENRER